MSKPETKKYRTEEERVEDMRNYCRERMRLKTQEILQKMDKVHDEYMEKSRKMMDAHLEKVTELNLKKQELIGILSFFEVIKDEQN